MYLSDRDIRWAIQHEKLTVKPEPDYDNALSSTSLDLRLGSVDKAKRWDIENYRNRPGNKNTELILGTLKDNYQLLSKEFLRPLPEDSSKLEYRRGNEVVIRQGGFLVWETLEEVGTSKDSHLICFVDGKSKLSRTGLLVHLTAPTVHTTFVGNIILEIANLGPFDFVLKEGDYVVQLTVARITSTPIKDHSVPNKSVRQDNDNQTAK